MDRKPRLLLVDDEPALLDVLGTYFHGRGYDVATAPDGVKAIAATREAAFDVVITDLKMPGLDGLQLLAVLKELAPATEVIILTGEGTMEAAIAALREGRAFDFVLKPVDRLERLEDAVARAMGRQAGARAPASAGAPAPAGAPEAWPAHLEPLTPRERDIMVLLAGGLDNRQIADRLYLSWKTVKNNLSRIYDKLQVANRTQAILTCQRHGLI